VQQFNRFGSPDAGLDRSPSRNSSVGDGASNSGWISSSDADSIDALRETVYVEDYALPSDFRSSSLDDKSTSSDSDTDEQQYMSTMASSQFSEDTSSGSLEVLNVAVATWTWTHGVDVAAFDTLQLLLHSDLVPPFTGLLRSLKGVRNQVLRFLKLIPVRKLSINLKTEKLPTLNRLVRHKMRPTLASQTKSTLYYHSVTDLIHRVLSNPLLAGGFYQSRYQTLTRSTSAPWEGFAWRSSYTLSKGPDPPTVGDKVLFPGQFISFPQRILHNTRNAARVKAFDLRLLRSTANTVRWAKVCSVVRAADMSTLECEVEPVLKYMELPEDLQSQEWVTRTHAGAEQRFVADFGWDKPVVQQQEIIQILDGILPSRTELNVEIRMVDMPLRRREPERKYVVTGILYCKYAYQDTSASNSTDHPDHIMCTEHMLRHASLRTWLFAELELLKYGYEYFLPFQFEDPSIRVIRVAIGIYDDDFNAYRGVYHGIGGVYLGILNLDWYERTNLRNIHPIMFIPHAADRTEIYHQMEKELRVLEEKGLPMEVQGISCHVFVKLLLQITDMPQGQSFIIC
jgi:hypothetical protein